MAKTKDLTQGNVAKLLLFFAFPTLLSNVFQQFYNLADTAIAGHILGDNALVAIGASSTVNSLVLSFAWGLNGGFGIIIAQCFGAKDFKKLKKSVAISLSINVLFSLIVCIFSIFMSRPMLQALNTPAARLNEANSYISVILVFIIVPMLYNLEAVILRSLGDSKTPLYFLILAALLNVALDLLFIIVFHMGVAGAAWATITAQGVSGLLCLVYIIKCVPELRLKREDWKFRPQIAKNEIVVGIPMGLQYSITAIGTMMVQSALNILGSYAVAAFTAGNKIENIFTQAYVAIGTTMATYNAQNIGASKLERVRQGFNCAHIIGIIYAIVTGVIIFFFGKYLSYLFISDNATEVIPMVDTYVKCVAVFFIPLHFVNALRNGIQGMGYGLLPMLAGVAELAGRGITAMIAAAHKSYFGACMASPMAWVLAGSLLIGMYFYVMKDMKKRLGL